VKNENQKERSENLKKRKTEHAVHKRMSWVEDRDDGEGYSNTGSGGHEIQSF
jgi:hypothetical protein